MQVQPIRDGFHTVTPYLLVHSAARLIQFLEGAFGAELRFVKKRADGGIMHAELRLGDSMLMLGEASDRFPAMPASLYLYVPDCDAVYERALAAGGESVLPIMTFPSGERYGGVRDLCGNVWWIATHVEDVAADEEERRWKQFHLP